MLETAMFWFTIVVFLVIGVAWLFKERLAEIIEGEDEK